MSDALIRIPLPLPTDSTVGGPIARLEPPNAVVEYDAEDDDGTLRWVRIRFVGVLTFDYRQEACCLVSDVEAYNCMLEVSSSPLLTDVRSRFTQRFGGLPNVEDVREFGQFTLYFDDVGCVEVIAKSFEIEPPWEEKAPK